jgi:hypothetical protein
MIPRMNRVRMPASFLENATRGIFQRGAGQRKRAKGRNE